MALTVPGVANTSEGVGGVAITAAVTVKLYDCVEAVFTPVTAACVAVMTAVPGDTPVTKPVVKPTLAISGDALV